MREIKFRAWLKKEKIMVSIPQYSINSFYGWNDKKTILMQYTGLKDKNSVEIYEGDIMMAPYMKKKPCVVEYSKTLAKFTMSGKFNFTAIDSNLEVIGNIHEKPELLN